MLPPDLLPEVLPSEPLTLFGQWFLEARERATQPNPDAMVVATVSDDGQPSARVVLCKRVQLQAGYLVFFTNYRSRKGRELQVHPRAAAVFHWDALHRQVRIEGRITLSPPQESDEYFASRALHSRIGAWASEQSSPLPTRELLTQRLSEAAHKLGIHQTSATTVQVPRPTHWGGFRLWIEALELWSEGANRVHDRAVWRRTLREAPHGYEAGPWEATRLYP